MTSLAIRNILVIFMVTCPTVVNGQGFIESFDGDGQYTAHFLTGLDNPDWIAGGNGELAGRGYHFENSPDRDDGEETDSFTRDAVSSCGFKSRLVVRELSLQPRFSLGSTTFVRMGNGFSKASLELWIAEVYGEFQPDPKTYHLFYAINNRSGTLGQLPAGKDISLQIEYDHQTSEADFTYDSDVNSDLGEVTFGPFPFAPKGMSLSAGIDAIAGSYSSQEGVIDDWSLLYSCNEAGDVSGNSSLDLRDIDLLMTAIRYGRQEPLLDFSEDGLVSMADLTVWITLKKTFFGDRDLDGLFNSQDLVGVLASGEYEDKLARNSTWATGDWNADGEFTSTDLVIAFRDGGYETGSRSDLANAVPEPSSLGLCGLGLIGLFWRRTGLHIMILSR